MGLGAWEEQALDSIEHGLASTDSRLAAKLACFTRLTSGEEMPGWERVRARRWATRLGGRAPSHSKLRRRIGRVYYRVGFRQAALLLWLVVAMGFIATGLSLNRGGGQNTCPESWVAACAQPARGNDLGSPAVRAFTPVQR